MRDYLQNIALRLGYSISKSTKPEDVRGFVSRARPAPISEELIRIGADSDGGYLLPDSLNKISACFSPGVATWATFEEMLAVRGIRSYLADFSVDAPPARNNMFHFTKKFIGQSNDEKYIRLEDWIEASVGARNNDLLLQMDIEGAEYEVIFDTPMSVLRRFRIMVIEFHGLGMLFNGAAFRFINSAFQKILSEFTVVHIHPNNYSRIISNGDVEVPGVLEFTFYRNDCARRVERALEFPHALDGRNNAKKPDIVLPRCWW